MAGRSRAEGAVRRVLRLVLTAGGVAVVAYLALLALMWWRQEALVFFPGRLQGGTPAGAGLGYEDVALTTADGVRLSAWWIPAEAARGAVVLCHGNAGTIEQRIGKARLLHELGLSVLLFDYRGYGGSAGEPSEEGVYRDAEAAFAHVVGVRGVPPAHLVLWGESLGGAVAVEVATRHTPALVVVESTFTGVHEMVRRHYPWAPVFLATRVRFPTRERVARLGCPLLVLHGPADTVVPFEMGEALAAAAGPHAILARLEGDHNDGGIEVSPAAQAVLRQVLERTFSR
jgi:uncharacterized protein